MTINNTINNKRIAKNTVFLYFRMLFSMIVSLYTSRVVLSMLGELDFGVYGVVAGFVTMFGFLNTSMTNAIQRFYNYEWGRNGQESITKVFSHAILIQGILALTIILILESFGIWYINNVMVLPVDRLTTANWVFQFSVLSLALVVINVPFSAAIMAYEKMDYYAIIGVLEVCIKLALAIALQYTDTDKLLFWGFLTPLTSLFTFLCYYIYSIRKLVYVRFLRSYDKTMLQEMLSFAGWNLFGSMAGVLREQGANLVLNYFFGPVVNAARAISGQVSAAVLNFVLNTSIAVKPQLTKSYAEGNIDKSIKYMYTISKVNFLSFILFALPLSIESIRILNLWLGEYPAHTSNFIVLIFCNSVINLLNNPISMIVHASGKMRKYQVVSSCISMIGIPIAFTGHFLFNIAPEYTLLCVFIFNLFGQISCLIILREVVIQFSVTDYLNKVVFPLTIVLLLSIILPLAARLYMSDGWIRFFLVFVVSSLSIFIFSYIFALNSYEKEMTRQIISKVKLKLH